MTANSHSEHANLQSEHANLQKVSPASRRPPKVPRPHALQRGTSPTLAALAERAAADPGAVDAFLASAVLPLVEPTDHPSRRLVSFCWYDADAEQVLLFANRLTDETRLAETLLQRLPGTDLWTLSVVMESDWRASYAFVMQQRGRTAPWVTAGDQIQIRTALDHGHADPHNPAACRNRAGVRQSVVELPDAPPQPHLVRRPDTPAGTVRPLPAGEGAPGHHHRRVTLWESAPPPNGAGPLAVVLDGEVWHDGPQDLPATLDNLVAAGAIPPCRALFVSSGGRESRWAELAGDGTSYLIDELLPLAQIRGWLPTDSRGVAVIGQSLGGLTALRLGLRHPDLVGTVLSQSASLWLDDLDVELARLVGVKGPKPRIHLAHGRQEWVLTGPHDDLAARLRAAGLDVHVHVANGGHDYAWWRGTVADSLVWAFG